jgi:hypothetical protein
LRRIARDLDVALSTASVWTRDIATAPAAERPIVGSEAREAEPRRWCSRCSRLRPASRFNRHPSGRQWWCRECFKAYYEEQRARHRRRNNALKTARVLEAQAFVLAHLEATACIDCGERDPVVLEFDHLGTKRAEVSTLVRRGVRLPVVAVEIARCDVVCAACHRRRTAQRAGWARVAADLSTIRWRSKAQERNVRYALDVLAGLACVDCGEAEVCVLDFDHVGVKAAM